MEGLLLILLVVGILYLIIWGIGALVRNAIHMPTWEGIIISAILGMLPLYLILCFFGMMGESRKITSNETQNHKGSYAEMMSKRYAYNNSSKTNILKVIVVGFVVISLSCIVLYYFSDKQEIKTPNETFVPCNTEIKEQKETSPVVNKKSSVRKQEAKKNSSNVKQEGNVDTKSNIKEKSTLEL